MEQTANTTKFPFLRNPVLTIQNYFVPLLNRNPLIETFEHLSYLCNTRILFYHQSRSSVCLEGWLSTSFSYYAMTECGLNTLSYSAEEMHGTF